MISRKLFRRQPDRFQRRVLPERVLLVRVLLEQVLLEQVWPKQTVRPAVGRAAAVRD